MRRLIVLLLCGFLFVGYAGCGGGDDENGSTDDAVQAKSTSGDDEAKDDSDAKDDSSDKSDSSAGDSGSSAAVAAFTQSDCMQAVQALSAVYGFAGLAMAGQTDELAKTQKELDELADKAPKELSDDIDTLRDAYGEYGRIIRESGWKPEQGAPPQKVIDQLEEAGKKLETDEVKSAQEHVDSWFKDECGS